MNRKKRIIAKAIFAVLTAVMLFACKPEGENWSAEPENIVELTDGKDGRCTVKALKDGTVTVTATAVDGGFTATCTVITVTVLWKALLWSGRR